MAPPMPPNEVIRRSFQTWNTWLPTIIFGFLGALGMYNQAWWQMDMMSDQFKATYYDTKDTFDFIVVGSGSAGAVVANRLSQHYNVLLLEAGGEPNPWFSVPAMSFLMLNYPSHDWMYKTVPQKHSCGALPDRRSGWSGGKCLGGTSHINFLIHLRGHQKDYDYIANITGDKEWSFDGVLKHFKSVEDYNGQWDDERYHGHGGDMRVALPPYTGMGEYFVRAGFSHIYYPIKDGRRVSTYKAFIEPIRSRPTLTIYKFSVVTKVLMRGENNQVFGVEYERHGVRKTAYANKEVILSAGSIGSPKILMLSGIGPKEHLQTVGVRPKVDLPVGMNLQDHISTYLGPFVLDEDKPVSMLFDRDINPSAFLAFTRTGTGALSSSGTSATAFVSTPMAKAAGEGDWPDVQFIFLGTAVYSRMAEDMAHGFHVRQDLMKKYFETDKGKDSFQIIVSLARPKAVGHMKLSGPRFSDDFLIDPKYLDNEYDVKTLVEGVKMAVNLVENTTVFQSLGARFTGAVFPGCENVIFRSDAYWECFIRQYSLTLHHIVGPCSMGRKGSKDAVVDTELKVVGTKGLRVIDASVLPKVPISNTNYPAIMVGEKGAHFVLNTWRNSENSQTNEIIR
ncbi:Glucose dehydrogenase [FAD, quinone] [Orchesella cincta]|uniref:Glucose dehydrogenase [FAD, quinone] n=1 Tax=Orchesella cincta TaxID=48709 RepID=A0A1D2MN95_ORCCI|nr:Glucose dehydrogenase [FAD, quinone] [Orchesella cincta]